MSECWMCSVQQSNACQFPPKPAFDTFAMGLVVYFMCTLRHLVQELERRRDPADTVVPAAEIQREHRRLGHRLPPDFVFKFLLVSLLLGFYIMGVFLAQCVCCSVELVRLKRCKLPWILLAL